MAIVLGISGALLSLQSKVAQFDRAASNLELHALEEHVSQLEREIARRRPVLLEEVQAEVRAEMARLAAERQRAVAAYASRKARVRKELEPLRTRAASLRQAFARGNWIQRVASCVRLRLVLLSSRRRLLQPRRARTVRLLAIQQQTAIAEQLLADPRAEVERRLAKDVARLSALRDLRNSPEAKGARGEASVIEELTRLPDCYHVLNNLKLEPDNFLRFHDKPLMSAQVDHVVVGPTGVFVIETKAWSGSFIRNGNYFDPLEQVGRAGHLCYCLLSDHNLASGVQNILATHRFRSGHAKPPYTWVVAPNRLASHIANPPDEHNRSGNLADSEVAGIVAFLRSYMPVASPAPGMVPLTAPRDGSDLRKERSRGTSFGAPAGGIAEFLAKSKLIPQLQRLVRSAAQELMLPKVGVAPSETGSGRASLGRSRSKRTAPRAGRCIRCSTRIKADPSRPYCRDCYSQWRQHENPAHREKICHLCGKLRKTTIHKPACYDCYQAYKWILAFAH